MNDLAVAYWESGRPARAIPLYEAALENARARLGDEHADTLTIIDNLAVAYATTGQAGRAIAIHETVLDSLEAKFGENHLTTLVDDEQSGPRIRGRRAAPRRRSRFMRKLCRDCVRNSSDDHPIVLTSMCGLARAFQSDGQLFGGGRFV